MKSLKRLGKCLRRSEAESVPYMISVNKVRLDGRIGDVGWTWSRVRLSVFNHFCYHPPSDVPGGRRSILGALRRRKRLIAA